MCMCVLLILDKNSLRKRQLRFFCSNLGTNENQTLDSINAIGHSVKG